MNATPTLVMERSGRLWWLCPACHKTLGEIVGTRLVVVAATRRLTFPLAPGTEQTCPRCGCASVIDLSR